MPDRLPVTRAQHGIWTGQQLDPDSPAFNTAEYVEIQGPVDTAALTAALRRTVAEVPAVRMRFFEDDDGVWQQDRPGRDWAVHSADLAGRPDPLREALDWMDADLARPVDLARDPLFGHAVFRLGEDRFLWYHRIHHIALDGYGLALFARRVADIYTALVAGDEPPAPRFGTLESVIQEDAAYTDSERCRRDRDHWTAYLADQPEPATLAGRLGALPRTVLRRQSALPRPTVEALAAAAEPARALWTDALTAAFAAYVHRMTGTPEVNLALPVMNRIGSAALRVPCMVLNVVPVRLSIGADDGLTALAGKFAQEVRRGRPHHRYRYEQLRRDLKLVASDRKMFGPSVNIMPFDYGLSFAGRPWCATSRRAWSRTWCSTSTTAPTAAATTSPSTPTRRPTTRPASRPTSTASWSSPSRWPGTRTGRSAGPNCCDPPNARAYSPRGTAAPSRPTPRPSRTCSRTASGNHRGLRRWSPRTRP